jgi:hypothetical protein
LVLLSLPWWFTLMTSIPPALMRGEAPPGEMARTTEVSTSTWVVERPVQELSTFPPPMSLAHR